MQVGEVFGTWVQRGEDAAGLGKDLQAFLDATRPFPKRRLVLAAFLEPEPVERGHEWYSERFWSLLAQLRARDEKSADYNLAQAKEQLKLASGRLDGLRATRHQLVERIERAWPLSSRSQRRRTSPTAGRTAAAPAARAAESALPRK